MNQRWIDYSLQEFADHLSAREPVPGGGGAAALIGALAAALCAMAGNYSTDKKSAEGHEEELRAAIDKAEELRMRLLALVDADAEAFAPLAAAWRLQKDEVGKAALQQATLDACVAPMDMLQSCAELVAPLETIRKYGAKSLQSDVGCAASALAAALECAGMNLLVNTRLLDDGMVMEHQLFQLLDAAVPRAKSITRGVMDELRR